MKRLTGWKVNQPTGSIKSNEVSLIEEKEKYSEDGGKTSEDTVMKRSRNLQCLKIWKGHKY